MAFQTPTAGTDICKGNFFPQTMRDWNAHPGTKISSAEIDDDFVAKFTSLMKAKDQFPQLQVLVNDCQFWLFISKLS